MDEGRCQSDEGVSHGQEWLTNLHSNMNCVSSPDENQNQLVEEGMDQGVQSGWEQSQHDSVNNNEEEEEEQAHNHHHYQHRGSTEDMRSQTQDSLAYSEECTRDTRTTGAVSVSRHSECSASSAPSHPEQAPPVGPSTGPHSSPPSLSLVASLQELLENSDHTLLPQYLHQIAEAYFLEEEYEWAVQFLQLERLYHERLLSNLAGLQEQWESQQKDTNSARRNATDHSSATLQSDQLETLTRICRTHQRSTLRPEKGLAVDGVLRNSLFPGRLSKHRKQHTTLLPCGSDSNSESSQMMEPLGLEEGSPAEDAPHSRALAARHEDVALLGHQGEELHSAPPLATPTFAKTGGCCPEACMHVGVEDKGLCEAAATAAAAELLSDVRMESSLGDTLTGSSSLQKEGHTDLEAAFLESLNGCDSGSTERTEPSQDRRLGEGAAGVGGKDWGRASSGLDPLATGEMNSPDPLGQAIGEGGEEAYPGAEELGEEEKKPEIVDVEVLEESLEYEGEEDSLGVDIAEEERVSQASLDDLAKRIQVEEIAPASGLVSILKRRASLDKTTSSSGPAPPKQATKRKVRFREPEEMMDQEEVGGDSWLLLLLLCLATVVISVGGTALYCTLGDVESSVCTDFSDNMDFYFGHVQRGLDELGHWFSSGS